MGLAIWAMAVSAAGAQGRPHNVGNFPGVYVGTGYVESIETAEPVKTDIRMSIAQNAPDDDAPRPTDGKATFTVEMSYLTDKSVRFEDAVLAAPMMLEVRRPAAKDGSTPAVEARFLNFGGDELTGTVTYLRPSNSKTGDLPDPPKVETRIKLSVKRLAEHAEPGGDRTEGNNAGKIITGN